MPITAVRARLAGTRNVRVVMTAPVGSTLSTLRDYGKSANIITQMVKVSRGSTVDIVFLGDFISGRRPLENIT